jgi:hypothetical protein
MILTRKRRITTMRRINKLFIYLAFTMTVSSTFAQTIDKVRGILFNNNMPVEITVEQGIIRSIVPLDVDQPGTPVDHQSRVH